MQSERIRRFLPQLLIVIATVLVWGHTIRFEFVWDDKYFIERLESIRSMKNIPEMFSSLAAQSSFPEGFVLFRPLRTVQYALLFQVGGGEPPKAWLFHLANIVWHGAAALLFYSVALILFGKLEAAEKDQAKAKFFAFFTALAFTVNPVVAETVCWAKSLDDLMATAFTLAATLSLLRWRGDRRSHLGTTTEFRRRSSSPPSEGGDGWGEEGRLSSVAPHPSPLPGRPARGEGETARPSAALRCAADHHFYLISLGWFLLAVYSKISAVPFALFSFFIFYYFHRLAFWRACRHTSGFLAIALLFMVHNHLVIGRSSQTAPIAGSYGQTLIDMLPVVSKYIRLLFGIPPFFIDYTYLKGGNAIVSAPVLAGLVLLIGLTMFCVWGLGKPKFRLTSLGLIWVGLFLLPVSNLLPMMQYMAERFLYLPLVGWLIALASLIWLYSRWRFALGLFGIVLLTWTGLVWNRSWIWRDDLTLFVQSSRAVPQATRVAENAVAAIFDLPQMKTVFVRDAKNAKQFIVADNRSVTPESWTAVINTLTKAQELFSEDKNVLNALGIAHARMGNHEQAIHFFQLIVKRHPDESGYWANLGQTCAAAKQFDNARQALNKALELDPNNLSALHALAAVCWQQNDFASALKEFEKLKQREPTNQENQYWLERAKEKLK